MTPIRQESRDVGRNRHSRQSTVASVRKPVTEGKILSVSLPTNMLRGWNPLSSMVHNPDNEAQQNMSMALRGLFRLWCHENSRIYIDRLTNSKDKIWFVKLLDVCLKYCYCGAEVQDGEAPSLELRGARRPRQTRPRGGAQPSASMNESRATTAPTAPALQLSDLADSGIVVSDMQRLLPKEQQAAFVTLDSLTVRGEDMSSIMFAKLPPAVSSDDQEPSATKPTATYSEVGDGQVKEAISSILSSLSSSPRLVMSREAMEKVIRLCRLLVNDAK